MAKLQKNLSKIKSWISSKMDVFKFDNWRVPLFTIRSHPKFITLSVVLAVFTDVILYGVIVPIFPFALEERANIRKENVQEWITILLGFYGLGLLIGSPAFGALADNWRNRRTPLLGGLFLLLTATLLLWFSHHIALMVTARFLQGLSCACVWSVGLALIVDTVGAEDSGLSIGIATMATSGGFILAPTIGGLIFDRLGYNAVFICCITLISIDIVLRLLIIEKAEAKRYLQGGDNDNTCEPLLPDQSSKNRDTTIPQVPTMIALLKSPRFLQSLLVGNVHGAVLTSFEATLPLHLKEVFSYSPSAIGLMFVSLIIPGVVAPWIGQAASRKGTKWFVTSGFLLMGINILLLRIPHSSHSESKLLTFMLLLFVGLGVVFVNSPNMLDTGLAVREMEANNPGIFGEEGAMAQAFGLANVAFAAGTIWGPLFAGFIKDVAGWGVMTTTLGILCLIIAIPAAIFTGGTLRISTRGPDESDSEAAEATYSRY